MSDHWQDWDEVSWKKKPQRGPGPRHHVDEDVLRLQKLDEETDRLDNDKISLDIRQNIQQARLAKKWSQKQLAQAINEQATQINKYESGKAVPDGKVLQKISRALGVKLK